MVTVKGVFKKLTTLDGLIKFLIAILILNMTQIGREFIHKIKGFIMRGIGGVGGI